MDNFEQKAASSLLCLGVATDASPVLVGGHSGRHSRLGHQRVAVSAVGLPARQELFALFRWALWRELLRVSESRQSSVSLGIPGAVPALCTTVPSSGLCTGFMGRGGMADKGPVGAGRPRDRPAPER